MPNLGIIASSISGNLWAPGKDFDSIATVSGTGSSNTISFTSIPGTYRHLQIRAIWNTTTGSALWPVYAKFNSDATAANYRSHVLDGYGAGSGSSYTNTTYPGAFIPSIGAGSGDSTSMSPIVMDILDYKETTKN